MDHDRDVPREAPTLAERVGHLQNEAVLAVAELAERVTNAEHSLRDIKQLRLESVEVAARVGVSKEEIAKAAGVSPSTIGNWLRPEEAEQSEPRPSEPPQTELPSEQLPEPLG
jgi:transcriptional regulator with XRE-family HTH domain